MILKLKKGQMEMFGMAFVVILVTIGILFAVKFTLNKPASNTKEKFTQKELAQNFVTTLLSTSTDCRDADLTDLLEDCGGFGMINCGANGDSCEYSEAIVKRILQNTLDQWKRSYRFKASTAQETLFNFSSGECLESRPGWGYIPLGGGGTLVVRLDIC